MYITISRSHIRHILTAGKPPESDNISLSLSRKVIIIQSIVKIKKVELENGTLVLVKRLTGTYGRRGPNKKTHPIEGMVCGKWKYEYGCITVFFAAEDLKIVY